MVLHIDLSALHFKVGAGVVMLLMQHNFLVLRVIQMKCRFKAIDLDSRDTGLTPLDGCLRVAYTGDIR